ncbi:N-acetylglutaminylglutamine synthetase [Roseibium limicola]|uniref:N-acetylglutaminylglutamine synthetase n=1 Tax=Roseibium limicola TaxID=2816037 RepID=A0A939JBC0_9HYPH|nr:N-acetylglutaminylglutamine synthetase [Roseibium limicola]MBO0347303.1 N-acetylglutaminylglutamine synthetase [Roseibium limicola]
MADQEVLKRKTAYDHRLKRMRDQGGKPQYQKPDQENQKNRVAECGWGRLIFGNTFSEAAELVDVLRDERPDQRDIAFYVRDPHVLLAGAPQELFLDPSHTYRTNLSTYRAARNRRKGFTIRRLSSRSDAEAINVLYASRRMVPVSLDFFWNQIDQRVLTVLVAEEDESGAIVGTAMGVNHAEATNGADMGSSLWCLAVSPQARFPGIGEALVRRLAEQFKGRGLAHMDLSVLHDNTQAIALYEKLGFERVPFFTVKMRNTINEALYSGPKPEEDSLNPYAELIVNEARKRGIRTDIIDARGGIFRLTYGGRSVRCRESLTDFTSGVAMSICDDKQLTHRVVSNADIRVPEQILAGEADAEKSFLEKHGSVVVKPVRGEQGKGISIGLTTADELHNAIEAARAYSDAVLIEECVEGADLRLVVIDYKVVACAIRKPAEIIGNGRSSARELIDTQSRRRAAATGGESQIPLDRETERCLRAAGFDWDSVVPEGQTVPVRKTANLHTGGTIHDVTGETNHVLIDAAIRAARAIEIPVTGIDLMVKSPREPDYHFIEANERPGLANHEPQPTAERFVDFLFPLSVPQSVREAMTRNGK